MLDKLLAAVFQEVAAGAYEKLNETRECSKAGCTRFRSGKSEFCAEHRPRRLDENLMLSTCLGWGCMCAGGLVILILMIAAGVNG